MKNIIQIVMLIVGLSTQLAFGQDNKGDDFWVCFPGNNGTIVPELYITSDVNTSGTVTIPGLTVPYSMNFNVTAGTITTVTLVSSAHISSNDFVGDKGVHIVANDDITVYGFSPLAFSTDAFLSFPVDAIGKEYTVLGYENVGNSWNGTQFGIVAAETGTTVVTITPTETIGARTAGVPYNISLTQGQTYMLRATSGSYDLTGSLISATKKIAVFGGNQCANIPSGYVYCDYLIEQIPPNSTWGKEFVTVPLATRINGDTYRIIAQKVNTVVKINGTTVATLGIGEFYEDILTGFNRITATEPVLVGQYSNSASYDATVSDPFFLLVPPTDQFLTSYTVNSGTSHIPNNYVNIISRTAQIGGVTVDGVAVPALAWNIIPGTIWSGAQVALSTTGEHTISSAFPIGTFVYGFGVNDSYGYLGGQSFSPVATVSSFTLTLANAIAIQAQTKCVEATVLDQNNNPVVGVKVDFTVQGANTAAGFGNTDANGDVTYCYSTCLAGDDTIIATIAGLLDTVYVTVLPSTLTVSPTSATVTAGTQQCVTATVKDGSNVPVPNAVINFQVTGDNPVAKVAISTNANGEATFCYTPSVAGNDVISVIAGCSNGNSSNVNVTVQPANQACNYSFSINPQLPWSAYAPSNTFVSTSGWLYFKLVPSVGKPTDYTYVWDANPNIKADWGYVVRAYPSNASWFKVTITRKSDNCVIRDSIFIDYMDIMCGNMRYNVCNTSTNTTTCAVGWNATNSLLLSGNYALGACVPKADFANVNDGLKVYPNPSNSTLNISMPITNASSGSINVLDMNGRVLYAESVQLNEGLFEHYLNVSEFANGVYSIQLISESEIFTQRVVIQH